MCFVIIINPTIYAKACLNAISIWGFKILPLLFPFFVITKMIVNLNDSKPNIMDKLFSRVYNVPNGTFSTFFLASLAGYPTGAKLICEKFENNQITNQQAKKMMSFCSVSGPMFMLGTVGIMMLSSYKAGVVVLISNIVASLLNGIIYRGKKEQVFNRSQIITTKKIDFADSVYDSLIAILMVGAYVVFSFLIIEIFNTLGIIKFISNAICLVFNCCQYQNVVQSFLTGIVEITTGINALSSTNVSLFAKTILTSALVGFGGLSVMMQNQNFLKKLKIPFKTLLLQKTTQCLLCVLVSALLLFFL